MALETGRKLLTSSPPSVARKLPPKLFSEFNEDFKPKPIIPDPRLRFDDSFPSSFIAKPRPYDPDEYMPKYLNEADIIFAQGDLEEKKRNEEIFEKRSNAGFCTLGFGAMFAFSLAVWQLYLMSVNQRSVEIDLYLKSVLDWKEIYSEPFKSLNIELLSIEDETPVFKLQNFVEETKSEVQVRIALNLAYIISDGTVRDKNLDK